MLQPVFVIIFVQQELYQLCLLKNGAIMINLLRQKLNEITF